MDAKEAEEDEAEEEVSCVMTDELPDEEVEVEEDDDEG